jgi:hypothetical protein
MIHNYIIEKIFESIFLINLFGDNKCCIYFLQIELNLWHENQKRQINGERGSRPYSAALLQQCFSANQPCFSITVFQCKH